MIGSLGPIVFVVSDQEIKTFEQFNRSESARWAKHDVLGKKPRPEFLGPDLGKISFTMRFDARYGVNPRKELDNLILMVRNGKAHRLVIGGKGIGVNKWYVSDTSQDWKYFDNKGNLLVGGTTVNLEEYL